MWNTWQYDNIYDVCKYTVKYCTIRKILSRQYFLDFTIFHNVSHVSQFCTEYCTASVCRCLMALSACRPARGQGQSHSRSSSSSANQAITIWCTISYNFEQFCAMCALNWNSYNVYNMIANIAQKVAYNIEKCKTQYQKQYRLLSQWSILEILRRYPQREFPSPFENESTVH